MHIRLLAVGGRQPGWVDEAFATYASRLPKEWRFELDVLPVAVRRKGESAAAVSREGQAVLGALRKRESLIALDEGGELHDSAALAKRLGRWLSAGRDLCFVIGGPDGLSAECLAQASEQWSLSRLTLPHGLARVVAAEQLYRAWTLQSGHPYHRA